MSELSERGRFKTLERDIWNWKFKYLILMVYSITEERLLIELSAAGIYDVSI